MLFSLLPGRHLLELDCEGDPAWECITNMHHWMQRLLVSTMHSYLQQGASQAQGVWWCGVELDHIT